MFKINQLSPKVINVWIMHFVELRKLNNKESDWKMLHQRWSVTWVCFSQSDSSSDNGGLCTVQYRQCTVCTAASPLSADPSLVLSPSHSASVSSE